MVTLVFRFVPPPTDDRQRRARDYFRGFGYFRACAAATVEDAEILLRQTYRGPDACGVGLTWEAFGPRRRSPCIADELTGGTRH